MRTTLNIPEDLLEEARTLLGFQSKTDAVIVALRELIKSKRIEELKNSYGKIDIKVDINKSRRRKVTTRSK